MRKRCAVTVILLVLAMSSAAYGAGSGMPWESPLQKILDSTSGPVAKVLGTLAIIVTGLGLAFGEAGGGMRRMLQIVFGLSIVFTAGSFFLSFFSFAGGVGF